MKIDFFGIPIEVSSIKEFEMKFRRNKTYSVIVKWETEGAYGQIERKGLGHREAIVMMGDIRRAIDELSGEAHGSEATV